MTQVSRTSITYPRRQNREITRNRNNTLTISETWQYESDTFLTTIPAERSAHPTFATTYLQGPVVGREEAGITTAVLTWVGFDASTGGTSDPADSPPRYYWDGNDLKNPITSLNNGAGKTYNDLIDSAGVGGFNCEDSNGIFIEFPVGAQSVSGYPLGGVTDYYDKYGSWNCERFASTAPGIDDACKIDPAPPGSPPALPADWVWLYMTPSWEELAGGLFFIRERWLPGNWNPDIYNTI